MVRNAATVVIVAAALSACSEGVSLGDASGDPASGGPPLADAPEAGVPVAVNGVDGLTVIADGADGAAAAALAINDPRNTVDEPTAGPWSGALRQRLAECAGGPAQDAADAFATAAFERVDDGEGEYLVSTPVERGAPEYIEFCVDAPELARYRILTRVRAPSPLEDSFFVTVDEDAPDTVPDPGIYDVSRSATFADGVVRTRTESPLVVTLTPGPHTIRFYAREPNVALARIALELDASGPPPLDPDDPATTDLARCSANTGIPEEELDTLITRYLGNVERSFVLRPFEEERGFTVRNDYRWSTGEGDRPNIMCLAPPPEGGTNLVDNSIAVDRLVFGSAGRDEHRSPTRLQGVFLGYGGDDEVGLIEGGEFVGGEGDDLVRLGRGGTFDGGPGDDTVLVGKGLAFDGGAGNDAMTTLFEGTFDGGAGTDTLERRLAGSELVSVEDEGVLFERLAPPTNLAFADVTATGAVANWSASPDDRTTGYKLTVGEEDRGVLLSIDLGIRPEGIPPNVFLPASTTTGTSLLLTGLRSEETEVRVRAYTRLADDSFLYSEPLTATFVPNEGGGDDTVTPFATTERSETTSRGSAALTASGSVLLRNFRAPSNAGGVAFVRLDAQLQNPTPIVVDELVDRGYRGYAGDTRQYAVVNAGDENPALVVALSADADEVLWTQPLTDGRAFGNPARSVCIDAFVTQDDWLVCVGLDGDVLAFDPDGTTYRLPPTTLQFRGGSPPRDGDGGRVVELARDERTDVSYRELDAFSGNVSDVTVDLGGSFATGTRFELEGLAVDGDHAILLAGFTGNRCADDAGCTGSEGIEAGQAVIRVLIDDGSVDALVVEPLEGRAGDGVGKVVGTDVLFDRGSGYARYDLETLALLDRRTVPGDILDFSGSRVLSDESFGSPVVEGYRLFLGDISGGGAGGS